MDPIIIKIYSSLAWKRKLAGETKSAGNGKFSFSNLSRFYSSLLYTTPSVSDKLENWGFKSFFAPCGGRFRTMTLSVSPFGPHVASHDIRNLSGYIECQ
jgi:hypothetical protein